MPNTQKTYEKIVNLKPVCKTLYCKKCNNEMKRENIVLYSYPAQYTYFCENCGEKETSFVSYPVIDFAELDENDENNFNKKVSIINEEKIFNLSYGDREVDIAHKVIKLSEEAGELSAAFLKYKGSKNVSATADGRPIDVVEEAFDCINVALDIIFAVERESCLSREDIIECTEAKLNKWENKQKGY